MKLKLKILTALIKTLTITACLIFQIASFAIADETSSQDTTESNENSFCHSQFDEVLKKFTSDGKVDYKGLTRDRRDLDEYITSLSAVSFKKFNVWSEHEQIAYLINYYNAATIQLIIDNYPVKSIKDLGGFFSSPWKKEFINLFGAKESLDHIEHEILRKQYKEPRVHFALVCASIGCPTLREEAYTGEQLVAQLKDQALKFLSDPDKNYWDPKSKTLYLSPIFKWFAEDFEKQSGVVWAFIYPYFPKEDRKSIQALTNGKPKIRYTNYDWNLNKK